MVCGGFVRAALIIHAITAPAVDVDIFLVAATPSAGLSLAMSIAHVVASELTVASVAVSISALTLYCIHPTSATHLVIQIILCAFPSIGAVLRSFDLTPCCLAWTGTRILTTLAGGYYLDTGVTLAILLELLFESLLR